MQKEPQTNELTLFAALWRSKRDLNSRAGFPTYALSRGASSTS